MALPLDSGPKLAVGQWIAWGSSLPGGSSSRWTIWILSDHSCHIYRTWKDNIGWGEGGWILKLSNVAASHKGMGPFLCQVSWHLKTTYQDFNLVIVGRLQSGTKIKKKTAVWTILCFSLLPLLKNVEEQWVKLASSNIMGLQHCIGAEGKF